MHYVLSTIITQVNRKHPVNGFGLTIDIVLLKFNNIQRHNTIGNTLIFKTFNGETQNMILTIKRK